MAYKSDDAGPQPPDPAGFLQMIAGHEERIAQVREQMAEIARFMKQFRAQECAVATLRKSSTGKK